MFLNQTSLAAAAAGEPANRWLIGLAVTLAISLIAAFTALRSARIAAKAQKTATAAQAEAGRLQAIEARNDERKYAAYRPMIELMHDIMLGIEVEPNTPEKAARMKVGRDFGTWISVFGSDEALLAYQRWCQGAVFQPTVPPAIMYRLWSDLILAARRDIGHPSTSIAREVLLAIRLRDYYEHDMTRDSMTLPFDELCKKYDWTPPWSAPMGA